MSATAPAYQEKVAHLPRGKAKAPVGRKTFKLSRSKLPLLMLAVLIAYFIFSFSTQFNRLSIMQRDVLAVEQQVKDLQKKNADLREQLKLVQSDAYVEQVAREKLGLVKPGESRIIPVKPAQ